MEKATGKVALGKKTTPFFEKTFIFFSYRIVIDLQDIWFLRVLSKISEKNSFLFYNFVKHSWSCGLSLICEFKSGLLFYSLLGLRFLSSGFFFFAAAVFHNINAPHRCVCVGGGGRGRGEVLEKISGTEQQFERKKDAILSCLKLNFIMSRWSLQCLESS